MLEKKSEIRPVQVFDENSKPDLTAQSESQDADFESMSKCPFCKEQIQSDAIKCKHCGSVLAPIYDNFPHIGRNQGFGSGDRIVSDAQEPRKPSNYVIAPPENSNAMLGHGWGALVVSFLFLASSGGGTAEENIGVALIGAVIVVPWSVWLLSKSSANKVLPAIALIITTLAFIGATLPSNT